MDIALIKKLMDEQVLDFPKLLMLHYKDIVLSELEAVVILELYNQLLKGNTFLNPSKIIKNMTIPKDDLLTLLDGLIKKGYLTISLKKQKNGKETEAFLIDETIRKLIASIESSVKKDFFETQSETHSDTEEIALLIETQFHKQLMPLEVEMIGKWINTEAYGILDIKKALLDAMKANRFSMSYVDSILLKRKKLVEKKVNTTEKVEKSEALKSFLGTFDQK